MADLRSTRRMEKYGELGLEARDLLQYLGFRSPAEITGRRVRGLGGAEYWTMTVLILAREREPRGPFGFTVNEEDFDNGVVLAAREILLRFMDAFREELLYTPFRFFPNRTVGGRPSQMNQYQDEEDPTVVHMARLAYGMEVRLTLMEDRLDVAYGAIRVREERIRELEARLAETQAVADASAEAVAATAVVARGPLQHVVSPALGHTRRLRGGTGVRIRHTARKQVRPAAVRTLALRAIAPPAPPVAAQDVEEEDPEERVMEEDVAE
jgi:hypothetical protein